MDENKSGLYIVAIVGMIAVVALVVLTLGVSTSVNTPVPKVDAAGRVMWGSGNFNEPIKESKCNSGYICSSSSSGVSGMVWQSKDCTTAEQVSYCGPCETCYQASDYPDARCESIPGCSEEDYGGMGNPDSTDCSNGGWTCNVNDMVCPYNGERISCAILAGYDHKCVEKDGTAGCERDGWDCGQFTTREDCEDNNKNYGRCSWWRDYNSLLREKCITTTLANNYFLADRVGDGVGAN